jgi:hypothetical protein
MQSLPDEIIVVICNYIQKITDKRKFIQTCKRVNNLTKMVIQIAELDLEAICNNPKISMDLEKRKFTQLSYTTEHSVEKFTLELCYDSYFNLIPKTYLKSNNLIIVRASAIYGQITLLKEAIKNGCKLCRQKDESYSSILLNICNYAVISGNLNMVKYAILHGCSPDNRTCISAAEYGHLHILKFLEGYGYKYKNMFACDAAALHGNLKMLKWLINNNYPLEEGICGSAACGGHINIIKWLMKNWDCIIDEETCEDAIMWGQLDTLKWLIEQKCPMNPDGCYLQAGRDNKYDIIEWLKDNGYKMSSHACAGAANSGHLDMLIWLKQNGFPWDEHVCEMAARNAKLDILKWLRQNGCPWNADTCAWSANNGHFDVFKWAVENGCDIDNRALAWAERNNRHDICNWLKERNK